MNVLIVEDSNSARRLMRLTFEHFNCSVIEAEDGQEGLDLATRHKPDIIISDALMPRMDGFQLLRALKANPDLKTIPFIFYSSTYTGEKEIELALSLGAEAIVAKPIEPEELWKKTCTIMKEWEDRQQQPAHPATEESNEQYLREYSLIVATKLEEKVKELEEALAERQRAENALKEREQELATIFENAPFVMLLLDHDRKVHKVNALAGTFTGTSSSDMIDHLSGDALRCVHTLDSPKGCGYGTYCQGCVIRRSIIDTFETGQSYHMVETVLPLSINGTEKNITLLFSTTRVIVAQQEMVLLSLQDISEHKRLEAQLQQAQKMESIGTLAGGIAHDFNNILTVIFGYGDITLMTMAADDPHRQSVEQMLDAAHRAASLAQDLLLFSRKKISDKKHVDLNEIVKLVEKFLLRVIGEDIDCTITLDNAKIPVFADAHQLEQVLMNLASNARDALQLGGSLSITTERITIDEDFIASHGFGKPGMHALLTVADTGTGMDNETREHIFDPFFTTKEIGKGTGLGLAVVYGIIKQHDGYIMVSSEPDLGTTFRIYLPLTTSAVADSKKETAQNLQLNGAETILLAEDNETVRNMVRSLLGSFGYEVIAAIDGEDAVTKFRENRDQIQLLLFDMVMPKKSGMDAYDEIRTIEPDIKVIFASGYATDAVHQRALVDPHVIFISKPYLPSNLLSMVRKLLNRSTARDSE